MSAKILITGGSGFVGRHCIQPILDTGCEVHVLSRSEQDWLPSAVYQHVFDFLDIDAQDTLLKVVKEINITHALHCAWVTEHGRYWTDPANTVWKEATVRFIRSFYEAGGIRAVGLGTCAEYDWSRGKCLEYQDTGMPRTPYGQAKRDTCHELIALADQQDASFAWARLFHLYGPYEGAQRLVPHTIQCCLSGEDIPCTDGEQLRDYMYIQDAADAIVTLLLQEQVRGKVNIGHGSSIKLKDLIFETAQMLDAEDQIRLGARQRPDGDPDELVPDLTRLSQEVCFTPSFSLKEGLAESIKYWKQNSPRD